LTLRGASQRRGKITEEVGEEKNSGEKEGRAERGMCLTTLEGGYKSIKKRREPTSSNLNKKKKNILYGSNTKSN